MYIDLQITWCCFVSAILNMFWSTLKKKWSLHNVTISTAWPVCQKAEWKVTVSLPSASGQAGSALEYSKFYQLPSSPLALLVPGTPEEEIYRTVSSVSGYVGFLHFKRILSWKYQKCKNPPMRPARVFRHKESDLVSAIILIALYIWLIKQKKKGISEDCLQNILKMLREYSFAWVLGFLLVFPKYLSKKPFLAQVFAKL